MPEAKPLNIILPEDLKAQFVNMVRIAHTPGEFVLDFTAVLPGVEDPKVMTRVVLSPLGMKLMQHAISDNLKRYESTFGEIRVPIGHTLADDLFKSQGSPSSSGEK
jgi:hypothetical protein